MISLLYFYRYFSFGKHGWQILISFFGYKSVKENCILNKDLSFYYNVVGDLNCCCGRKVENAFGFDTEN